ncbi:MAG: sigma-70 family RNA polymerase sigma factor [Planctomycetota bacterium]
MTTPNEFEADAAGPQRDSTGDSTRDSAGNGMGAGGAAGAAGDGGDGGDARPDPRRSASVGALPDAAEAPADAGVTVDFLLGHAGFVRSLARRLLRDEAEVDDVVQETLTRALQNGPRRRESAASWFRAVVQNVAFKGHRSRSRRARRELEAAKPEALASTADLFVRDMALRDLTAAVLSLPDQAREAVMLRYFEGLSPQEIGERLALPPGTVRMRLHRAVAALRRRLDELSDGDRAQWMRGLALLGGVPLDSGLLRDVPRDGGAPAVNPLERPAPATGWQALTGLHALALIGAAVLIGSASLWGRGGTSKPPLEGPQSHLAALAPVDTDRTPPTPLPSLTPQGAASAEVRPARLGQPLDAASTSVDGVASASAGRTLAGRVVDQGGRGVGGATVLGAWGASELIERGTSRGDGSFELALGADAGLRGDHLPFLLAASADGHAPSGVLIVEHTGGVPNRAPVLELRGPGARLSVQVVDASGVPVAGARVSVGERLRLGLGVIGTMTADEENPLAPHLAAQIERTGRSIFTGNPHLRGSLGAQLLARDGTSTRQVPARALRTDASGVATFEGLEPGAARVFVSAQGFAPLTTSLHLDAVEATTGRPGGIDDAKDALRQVTLARGGRVTGRATRADGLGQGRVLVHLATTNPLRVRTVRADSEGRFAFEDLPLGPCTIVAEELQGNRTVTRGERSLEVRARPSSELQLNLTAAPTLRVRLSDGSAPLAGWRLEARAHHNPTSILERARTDDDGMAALAARHVVPADLYIYPADPAWNVPIQVTDAPFRAVGAAGAQRDVAFEIAIDRALMSGSTVSGRLLLPGERPAPVGTYLQFALPGSSFGLPVQVLDDDGRFAAGPLPPGRYRVSLPYYEQGLMLERLYDIGGIGPVELGAVIVPELARLELGGPRDRARWVDAEVTRCFDTLDSDAAEEREIVFQGRIEAPQALRLAPGTYEVKIGGAVGRGTDTLQRRVTLAQGSVLQLAID